jgi:hypothetical protein
MTRVKDERKGVKVEQREQRTSACEWFLEHKLDAIRIMQRKVFIQVMLQI